MSLRASRHTTVPLAAAITAAALLVPPAEAASDGLRVARDPQTGQVRAPTPEEARALDAVAEKLRAAKGNQRVGMASGKIDPQPVRYANGSVGLELDESTLSYTVARRKADGGIEMVCVEGSEAAQKALSAPQFANRIGHKTAKGAVK